MKKILHILRRLFIPDISLKGLQSKNVVIRLFAGLYISAQPLAVFLALWAFWWEPSSLRVVDYDFTLPREMADWRGKSIAVIADLHAGSPYIDDAKIDKVVDMTLAAKPDLILLPGDFVIEGVWGGTYMPPDEIAAHLKRLRAPLGVYAALGNHDHWDDVEDITGAFRRNGIAVLEDRTVNIPGTKLWLAGLSDLWTGRLFYTRALRAAPPEQAVLCMTHQPDTFPLSPPACRFMVAGHTHGGQVKLPLIGTPVVSSQYGSKYVKGFVTEKDRTIFVSSGVGTSRFPVRFGVPPEISVLHFK